MFDIGFLELIIVSIVGLLVLGPDRLPGAIRTVTLYLSKIRRSFNGIRAEIERELKADEIRQDLHNQKIMQELREAQKSLQDTTDAVRHGLGHNPDVKLGKDGYPEDEPFESIAPPHLTGEQSPAEDTSHADAASDESPADDAPETGEEPNRTADGNRR